MTKGYVNIIILLAIMVVAGANISYQHGELQVQYLGAMSLVEILKDGLGSGVATLIGWMWMRSPIREEEKIKQ